MGSLNEDAWKNLADAAKNVMPMELAHRGFYSEMCRKQTWDARLNDAAQSAHRIQVAVGKACVAAGLSWV